MDHPPVVAPLTTGQRVRAHRERLGLTQEQLAFKSGVSLRTVVRVENDRHAPTIATLEVLATALGCTVADLLADAPPVDPAAVAS